MSFVVTAATGNLGTLAVQALLARGVAPEEIVATGRSEAKLAALAALGVRTAVLDYDAPVDGVFEAGDTVLLISGSEVGQRARQHQNLIEVARRAEVARVVYTSLAGVDTSSLVLAPEHLATEQALKDAGLTHTILRNGWYTENSLPAFEQAQQTGSVLSSAGEGRTSSAPRADYAEAAAIVMTTAGHDNAVYELGGDTSWTAADLARTFSEALERDIDLVAVDGAKHAEILAGAGLDEGLVGFLVGIDRGTAAGDLQVESGDLSRLLGRPTTPLAESVRSWVA